MTKISPNCLLLVYMCLLFAFKSWGQSYYNQRPEYIKANSQWALSNAYIWSSLGGLNFNTNPATVVANLAGISYEGIASVADPTTGVLLFYSNGGNCMNANNQIMLNGDSLLGNNGLSGEGQSTTQGVCIVPFIDQPGKYYLFSLCGPTSWSYSTPTTYLYYSIIDMSLDGGLGAIVPGQKNVPLGGNIPLSESMIAIPGNNCDIWLMVHEYINPVFKAFHITRQGVDTIPVTSNAGTQIQGNASMGAYYMGGMAVSPDRKIIGISSCPLGFGSSLGNSGVLLCKFDAGTGTVGSSVQVNQTGMMTYTLAISPDNTKLYVCAFLDSSVGFVTLPCPVLQYDISVFDSASIATSQVTVGQLNGEYNVSGYFKSYDGKIYLLPFLGMDSLFVINQPNQSGLACNYQYYQLGNANGLSFSGPTLPNDVVYPMPADTISIVEDTQVCTRNHIFENTYLTAPPGYYGYVWNDGSTDPIHSISAAGTYWVLCKDSCHSLIDSIVVGVIDIPLSLAPDTTLCNQATLTLDATIPGGSGYVWQDSSKNSIFPVSDSGTFWVQVSAQGCTVSDTLRVKVSDIRQNLGDDIILCRGQTVQPVTLTAYVPDGSHVAWSTGSFAPSIAVTDTGLYWVQVTALPCVGSDTLRIIAEACACRVDIPNAFSPNGDGHNEIFMPAIEKDCPVQNYVLNVYNRYGNRVYSGHSVDQGWNGCYSNGAPADADTYMYEIIFSGGTQAVKNYRKGDVLLIR